MDDGKEDGAQVIPSVELKGSRVEKLKAIDEAIAGLQRLRQTVVGGTATRVLPSELRGRYINAPVWPWFAAGWVLGALFVLLFVVAWHYA